MRKIKIYDSAFLPHTKSASIGGENIGVGPANFEWTQEGPATSPTFFTDGHIKDVMKYGPPKNSIAWLLEPYHLRPENYEAAIENEKYFKKILTFESQFLYRDKWHFYPYGGSWIDFKKWGLHEKSKQISMIMSDKTTTEGHQLRHLIAEELGDRIDIFGHGINPIESKFDALAPYKFSVVIESGKGDFYFTEKLIDCLSVGTIPLYWGANDVGEFFNTVKNQGGIIEMNDSCVIDILQTLSYQSFVGFYNRPWGFEKDNLETAMRYRVCEDYIWSTYPELFLEEDDKN